MTLKTKTLNISLLLVIVIFLPWLALIYLIAGVYDVSRNRPLNIELFKTYFMGMGIPTFIFSPINMALDFLTLPFLNKKIYKLNELPKPYIKEINAIINVASNQSMIDSMNAKMQGVERGMVFYQWYGFNVENSIENPIFNKKFKYIKTVGVSIFNKKVTTNKHFGPFRATLRVLYNINDIQSKDSYISTMGENSHWNENKLFIFDDTLLHQSVNQTDEVRYCMFIDILRPSILPFILSGFVTIFGFLFKKINLIFYKSWKPLA
ncbi:MAG: aspartyl/asparaginyl beta-hydroxylase domain-containing protein [Candidatus Thioglobus sp.]|nr:MAG: aspartyl/asparaginyl beta-hydroxylase domain-containing protein [Candidatus Thioglobus sp.]